MQNMNNLDSLPAHSDSQAARERLMSLLIAADLKRQHTDRSISPRGNWEGLIPVSFAQERLWFLDQMSLAGAAYNVPVALRLSGKLEDGALERSFAELVRRHEILRTRFGVKDGVPHQLIDPPRPLELRRTDLSHLDDPQMREHQLHNCIQRERMYRFDLHSGPLLRILLVELGVDEHALLLTMHHIIVDAWSLRLLVNELSAVYSAYVQGQPSPLPGLVVQYADYAIWQRQWLEGEVLQEQLQYWRQTLLGAPPQLQLPTDRTRPAVESFRGATLGFEIPRSLFEALKELGNRAGATLFMVSLAAFQLLLSRWSGEQDIVVGVPIAERKNREVEGLIGFFINTLVMRTDVSEDLTFRELLDRVKHTTVEAYAHQDLPFDALVRELRPDRNLTQQPVFQVALSMENQSEEQGELLGLRRTWIATEWVTTHFDLTLYLVEGTDTLSGTFEYATDLFDVVTIERMAGHYRTLLEGIAATPNCPITQLSMLCAPERHHLLVERNATASSYPHQLCVHDLFAEQAERTPEATALVFGETSVTYADLNSRANELGRSLRNHGVGPDRLVGVCIERSVEMVVSLLAILKAGGAYVPLDPNYPRERLRYMLEDASPQVILTQGKLITLLPTTPAELISLDEPLKPMSAHINENVPGPGIAPTAQNLVYVIYTSGSTGRPKGTAMTHGSMVNLIEWHRRNFGGRDGKRVLQFAALSFDVAFQEIFSTLCTGGALVLVDEWVRRDPHGLTEFVSRHSIDRLFIPPLVLQSLAEFAKVASAAPPMSLRDVITAGEQLRITPEIASFFKQIQGCRLHNHYGPTETHVVTALTLAGDPSKWPAFPAIGNPISNTQIYVLDTTRQPVPIGVMGEIYVGGANVARGYHGRPELTAQRFVSAPFGGTPRARLYRTGDVGRWRVDGTLEYLGRNDDQVKIRGYRIELGEIEVRLAQHEQVREAAVIAREDAPGEKRLVAYVTLRNPISSVEDLRAHLRAELPEHMLPAAFVILESLPLTPNGKLDRRALPAPEPSGDITHLYEAPQGEVEKVLADIWAHLLQRDQVDRHDNFFELGGHSLHAMKLIAKVTERLEVRLSAISVFQHPTIQQMASVVQDLRLTAAEQLNEVVQFDEGVI